MIARHTLEVLQLALDEQASFKVLEDILHSFEPAWPRWCSTAGLCAESGGNLSNIDGVNLSKYVVHLIDYLGHDDVFHGLTAELARPWLAVEILFECQVLGMEITQEQLTKLL